MTLELLFEILLFIIGVLGGLILKKEHKMIFWTIVCIIAVAGNLALAIWLIIVWIMMK